MNLMAPHRFSTSGIGQVLNFRGISLAQRGKLCPDRSNWPKPSFPFFRSSPQPSRAPPGRHQIPSIAGNCVSFFHQAPAFASFRRGHTFASTAGVPTPLKPHCSTCRAAPPNAKHRSHGKWKMEMENVKGPPRRQSTEFVPPILPFAFYLLEHLLFSSSFSCLERIGRRTLRG